MTGKDNPIDPSEEGSTAGSVPARRSESVFQRARASIRRHPRWTGLVAVAIVAALIGAAYVAGGPPEEQPIDVFGQRAAAATAGPAMLPGVDFNGQSKSVAGDGSSISEGGTGITAPDNAAPVTTGSQIIVTGQLSLEVSDVDKAIGQARSVVIGAGGSVAASYETGAGDSKTATYTFRIPAAKWDDTLASLRGVGSKVLSEQTNTNDVTGTAVDLQARIDNLQRTETALQAIMTRATQIADVIAVETQLSQVQGQIEELTAQMNQLKDQVAMSTLAVSFSLPSPTVTTQATHEWTLGSQVDQAVAALIRIGQGLATLAVWAAIVLLPIVLGLVVLMALFLILRRIFGRGRRSTSPAG